MALSRREQGWQGQRGLHYELIAACVRQSGDNLVAHVFTVARRTGLLYGLTEEGSRHHRGRLHVPAAAARHSSSTKGARVAATLWASGMGWCHAPAPGTEEPIC
jgi:hypothetical protein